MVGMTATVALLVVLLVISRHIWRLVSKRGNSTRGVSHSSHSQVRVTPGRQGKKQPSKHVSINSRASCITLPSLTELPEEVKATYWWTAEDFEEFVRVRLEVAKAYKKAARALGVDVGGAYPPVPALAHESRRGLGLGRKVQRARNRDRYIRSVLEEQERQKKLFDAGKSKSPISDVGMLSSVALKCSEKDRVYAHETAQMYYEQDQLRAKEEEDQLLEDAEYAADVEQHSSGCITLLASSPLADDSPSLPLAYSFDLGDDDQGKSGLSLPHLPQKYEPSRDSLENGLRTAKGFGLSREKLKQVGLSCTGHKISKYQRLGKLPLFFSEDAESDAASSAESDCGEAATVISEYGTPEQYRNWRMKALGLTSDDLAAASFPRPSQLDIASPDEYRAWRRSFSKHRKGSKVG
eukprot:TRINITY_DN11674_c0_g1_i1.p1 TRINITY_DN11674_c0_g1~~TRINITY_DN11674_c0_g1_i1.p1  ORF type:complete len:409 (-),score=62.65 TRINITY_DN11674_c0_g1_i1:61-1287(-)